MLTFDGDDHGYDTCRAVTAGVNDEIIVTGQTQRFAQGANAWIRAWSATGTLLWNHELSTPSQGWDAGNDVTVLSDGTAVVAGQWYSGASRQNHFLSRVSTAGAITTSFGELFNDDMYLGVARDNSNAIIAGGWKPDTGGSSTAWWRKLAAPPSLAEVWSLTRNSLTAGPDAVNKVATDSANAVIVAGYATTATGRSGWIGKYTSSGGPQWISTIAATGTGTDGAYDVGVGPGNVVVAVGRSGTSSWIRSYSSTGVLAWTITEPGVIWRSVAVDGFGNIATAGNVGSDLYVRVHDSGGNVYWDYTYPNATGNGVAFDSLSNVLVCGEQPAGTSSDALVLTLP
ncbi:MAG TPA: hypothetical protein VNO30_45475 [Kofleriaceae bacterium]|nr:hypothetical protein [Kofleriaceae bacterium]